METSAILQHLKDLRSKTHAIPIKAVELDLDRLILRLEREIEVGEELDALFKGQTLVNVDATLKYTLVRK